MVATAAATVFVTGAMKGAVGLGLSTGSVVVFSLRYGLESVGCLLIAPTVAANLGQGGGGGHAHALVKRFCRGSRPSSRRCGREPARRDRDPGQSANPP